MKAVMLLALGLSVAHAAEPTGTLTLACVGTATDVNNKLTVSTSKGIIVDLAERTVKGFGTPVDKVGVTGVNEAHISFGANINENGWSINGSIDRVTGDLEAYEYLWGKDKIAGMTTYLLQCKPTQRMF
jgi:hypothetical protein